MRSLPRKGAALLAFIVLAACLAQFSAALWRDPYRLQWDFHTYYHAAAAHAAGLDPYDAANISKVSGKNWTPAFLYPPLTLPLFSLLRAMEYPDAARAWLVLKLVLVGGLVLIWQRDFARLSPPAVFAAYLCFGFGATFAWDLRAGNVSVIEQFLLWTAFAMLLRDLPWAFCALLLAASLFKLTFMAFLPLLLLFDQPRKRACLAVTLLAFAAYVLANHLVSPAMFAEYVRQAAGMDDLGSRYNSGMLAFIRDLYGGADAGTAAAATYAVVVVALLVAVARRLGPVLPTLAADRPLAICLACSLYAVLMPRMKSYSYIILVLPAFLVVARSIRPRLIALALLVLFALPLRTPFPLPVAASFAAGTPWARLKDYWLLWLAWLVLWLFVRHVRQGAAGAGPSPAAPPPGRSRRPV